MLQTRKLTINNTISIAGIIITTIAIEVATAEIVINLIENAEIIILIKIIPVRTALNNRINYRKNGAISAEKKNTGL